jgi:hypothetical protein
MIWRVFGFVAAIATVPGKEKGAPDFSSAPSSTVSDCAYRR